MGAACMPVDLDCTLKATSREISTRTVVWISRKIVSDTLVVCCQDARFVDS